MLPHICPDCSSIRDTTVTMSLQDHPTVQIELPVAHANASNTGILNVSILDVLTITLQYWTTIKSILPTFTNVVKSQLQCALFYAVLFQSGMDLPPSKAHNHQHDFRSTPRDGDIHNFILLFDVYIFVPNNSGWYNIKGARQPNNSNYQTGDTADTTRWNNDGTTTTTIVSATGLSHTNYFELKNPALPLS